jgi:hypothetical protein
MMFQAPAASSAAGKRPHPSARGDHDHDEEGPRLNLVTALPLSVWQEHLGPMLSVVEAAHVRVVCKALKVLVMEWPTRLVHVEAGHLETALTCFPATEILNVYADEPLEPAGESALVEVLRGHGATIKRVHAEDPVGEGLLASAVRAGALPNLTRFDFSSEAFQDPARRQLLSGGMLGLLELTKMAIEPIDAEQVAALGHLRHLPHLRILGLTCYGALENRPPAFISPSLKVLCLDIDVSATLEALLREVPSMLQASGASLEVIEIAALALADEQLSDDAFAALARVLRACSSTMKDMKLMADATVWSPELVAGLTSCCDTLEVLSCRTDLFTSLPAACSFPRLTELRLMGKEEKEVDVVPRVLDLMANGRLPALAALHIRLDSEYLARSLLEEGARGGGGRLGRAFEAVAGTLRRLTIMFSRGDPLPDAASYELGAAIGKLRRLRYLELDMFPDARGYRAVAGALVASGGCPELFKLHLMGMKKNLLWLAREPSLILPSVRNLRITAACPVAETDEEALLLCCGLVEAGYQYLLHMSSFRDGPMEPLGARVRACMQTLLRHGSIMTGSDWPD